MKIKTPLLLLTLLSSSVSASGFHLSPEIKIGAYHGFGIQAGITQVADLGAIYLSYSDIWYESGPL